MATLPDIKSHYCPGCYKHFWPFQGIYITSHCRECEDTVKALTCQTQPWDIHEGRRREWKCITVGCFNPISRTYEQAFKEDLYCSKCRMQKFNHF